MPHPDLENLRQAVRGETPESSLGMRDQYFRLVNPATSRPFWWLWTVGTFAPTLVGLLIRQEQKPNTSTLASYVLLVGFCSLLLNLVWAAVTDGYSEGETAAFGQMVARGSGYISAVAFVLAMIAVALVFVIAIVICVAVLHALVES